MYYGSRDTIAVPVSEKTPHFQNIHLSNITATDVVNSAEIIGLPEAPVEDFSIVNSNFKSVNGFSVSFTNGFNLKDVSVDCAEGIPLKINNAEDVEINNFSTGSNLGNVPVIALNSVNGIIIHNCSVKNGTDIFLESSNTNGLRLKYNFLGNARVLD